MRESRVTGEELDKAFMRDTDDQRRWVLKRDGPRNKVGICVRVDPTWVIRVIRAIRVSRSMTLASYPSSDDYVYTLITLRNNPDNPDNPAWCMCVSTGHGSLHEAPFR